MDLSATLISAVSSGNTTRLQLELSGRDVQQILDNQNRSLLHYAATFRQVKIAETLLGLGANINAVDKSLNTPLHNVLLEPAYEAQNALDTIRFLVCNKSNINAQNIHGRTPLMLAVVRLGVKSSKLLLGLGADPNIGDKDGLLPIHVAATHKHQLLVDILQYGPEIDKTDSRGRTAVYYAVLAEHLDNLELLLQHGCDVSRPSAFGSPLQMGITKCNLKIVKLLLSHGACVGKGYIKCHFEFGSAKNVLDLALSVVERRIQRQDNLEKLHNSLSIAELMVEAYGNDFKLIRIVLNLQAALTRLQDIQALANTCQKLHSILRKLAVLLKMKGPASNVSNELAAIGPAVDHLRLENICVMHVRRLVMETGGNLLWCVEKLDCSRIVKENLLLKHV